MQLSDPVTVLRGVGNSKAAQLNLLDIYTLKDLIYYYPKSYEDRTQMATLCQLQPGEPKCFLATVTDTPRTSYVRKGLTYTKCSIADSTVKLHVTWFNQPWMSQNLVRGQEYYFYGALAGDDRRYELSNPIVESPDAMPTVTRCIIPVYRLTKGVSSKMLQNLIFTALSGAKEQLTDLLPKEIAQEEAFMPLYDALLQVHRPTSPEALQAARQRLIFQEFFLYAMGVGLMKASRGTVSDYRCKAPIPQSFYDHLEFSLTAAQSRVLMEISGDLQSGRPMNRLVQGDVGSGKTMVALGAMLQAVTNGYQAALMAPTELLAQQHYRTITHFLSTLNIRCALLTGAQSAKEKREIRSNIEDGTVKIIIGTHALFSDNVSFHRLGLVVIDEQHRFGVAQRAALSAKGHDPHMLVLSATPIPRTLALILYGDLDVSVIDELPPGREPIETFLVNSAYRSRLLGFIRKQVTDGHQVYVVCPAVEENLETGLTSAEQLHSELASALPGLRVGLVHGQLPSQEKDAAMSAFARQETDILVATTVIEVGVDVKNATLMVIVDADRFGLSQLHQLRGRVGRGSSKSYCILVSDNRNAETRKRLKALCSTEDGFAIAQKDLEIRGPGDFFGSRQSGLPMFHLASLSKDMATLQKAQDAAKNYLSQEHSPEDSQPLLDAVHRLFSSFGNTFN